MTITIHDGLHGDDDELGTIHYTWLANTTRDWAAFVRSFLHSCVLHREHHVRHAPAVRAQHGLREADTFFDDLRMRYLTIVQKAHGPYRRSPYTDIATLARRMPANEIAFDRAVYDIFFGGPRAADRPQQIIEQLQPHCDLLLSGTPVRPSWEETTEEKRYKASLLASIEIVAKAVGKVSQQLLLCCEKYRVNSTSLSVARDMVNLEEDDDDGKFSDLDYHFCE
ncbi:hypothetical protein Sste5346_004677 [Sporothrix stenoceras]|uniref:Uncharacterized protein n=1 Tax=Sporothrix stenoceras TaxID=5173 RepID=A0ABR3Z7N9_9PEZI